MRYTTTTLKKLEDIFNELDYTIRYEKGNFQSGYCIVEDRKIAVVSKFYDTEGRINCLIDILQQIQPNLEQLPDKSREFLTAAMKQEKE